MSFNVSERYNSVIIEFKGNVMGGPDAVSLNEKLHELIGQDKTNIVVDLGKVKFMNSSGLGMLIGALTTMRKAGGDLLPMPPTKSKACSLSQNSLLYLNITNHWMKPSNRLMRNNFCYNNFKN